jgi:hypothetical protein
MNNEPIRRTGWPARGVTDRDGKLYVFACREQVWEWVGFDEEGRPVWELAAPIQFQEVEVETREDGRCIVIVPTLFDLPNKALREDG